MERWKPFSVGGGSSGIVAADRSALETPAEIGGVDGLCGVEVRSSALGWV